MHAETIHLIIRDLEEDDWQPLFAFASDPRVRQGMGDYLPGTEDGIRTWVQSCIYHNQQLPRHAHNCAIVLRATNEVIGWIGFGDASPKKRHVGDVDFGYALNPDHWNRGYGTEALKAMLDFCFQQLGVKSVFGEHGIQNPASGRVMQKAGMQKVDEQVISSEDSVYYVALNPLLPNL